ncbi:valine--tRNA ligase, mitochondrial 1, partial [Selaginella moellendorffii]|uniref:valine--tRNA ligase, mitochondrial 1 n=1 Tax=Selaginella moellendorffii TaxID=88036 RepID=UPI000D1CA995
MAAEKKRLDPTMEPGYNPADVQAGWYSWWEACGFFGADAASTEPKFVMVLPPPNVTGHLHLGHALTVSVQDALVRHSRMSGRVTLWLPGVDHAGIATQVVVEKKLASTQNLTRHDLGRDAFVEKVWEWKTEYGGAICSQLRTMGASLDWSRECFTMDLQRSRAVTEAFVRLYKAGLIYRANRMVKWDCSLKTAISDIEVEHTGDVEATSLSVPGYDKKVPFGWMFHFAYPVEGSSEEIVVATTRPETMFGDTAVAVHPDDPRFAHLHGKFLVHPFNGRRIPVIKDSTVKINEGTGAVKITPAHDEKDFERGKRHGLEFINILTDDGRINENGGHEFEGLKRYIARERVLEALERKKLFRGKFPHKKPLAICSRSSDVLEPMMKPQWYVDCKEMAARACEALRNNELQIVPSSFADIWFRWLENIEDWCVSRQLWWGHRIPAWYAVLDANEDQTFGIYDDHWAVADSEQAADAEIKQRFPGATFKLQHDPDVLDTWFSSGLFPFSSLGWPDSTADYAAFYPTTVLETGHDILFFWVARMVMLGTQLTGQLPFKTVLLHGMVRDAHKRKMSKSLGNVIDPLDVISGISLDDLVAKLALLNLQPSELKQATEGLHKDFPRGIPECGVDALRFGLIAYTAQAENMNLNIQRFLGYRQWCNKLWNAVRFVRLNFHDGFEPEEDLDISSLPWSCKWILSSLNDIVCKINKSFARYDLSGASSAVYSWWQYSLCDVFIELVKPLLSSEELGEDGKAATRSTLYICLDSGLRMLHPFMPFITEELWQRLPHKKKSEERSSIMTASYPTEKPGWSNHEVEKEMELISSVVKTARSLHAAAELKPRQRFAFCYLVTEDEDRAGLFNSKVLEVLTLAKLSSVKASKLLFSGRCSHCDLQVV